LFYFKPYLSLSKNNRLWFEVSCKIAKKKLNCLNVNIFKELCNLEDFYCHHLFNCKNYMWDCIQFHNFPLGHKGWLLCLDTSPSLSYSHHSSLSPFPLDAMCECVGCTFCIYYKLSHGMHLFQFNSYAHTPSVEEDESLILLVQRLSVE